MSSQTEMQPPTGQQGMGPTGGQTGMQPQGSQLSVGTQTGGMGSQSGQMGGQSAGGPAPQSTGGQMGMQQSGGQQASTGLQPVQQRALDSITQAIEVCEWCADQCIAEADPQMIECIRLCEDVSELGEAAQIMLSRQSQFSQPLLQTFTQAVQACMQECQQHPHGHCQECGETLERTLGDVQQILQ